MNNGRRVVENQHKERQKYFFQQTLKINESAK